MFSTVFNKVCVRMYVCTSSEKIVRIAIHRSGVGGWGKYGIINRRG